MTASRPTTPPGTTRTTLALSAAVGALLALLGAVAVLAVQMHFEARDREHLHLRLEQARQLLATVDNTAALAELPARLSSAFRSEDALAVRVQGALDQALFEQAPHAAMPAALLARPAQAHPAPLVTWVADRHHWRGSALVMRMPLDGAAPLTVAVAVNTEREYSFLFFFRAAVAVYVVLATLLWAALAHGWLGRAGRR
ncbi:hypothetical protein [Ottowia sp.]|uniref:hypothetical protein n=1 Tax=Ottowia sp. TaxID=1898956 RepID=UPI003A892F11